jgi:hypothetical protein
MNNTNQRPPKPGHPSPSARERNAPRSAPRFELSLDLEPRKSASFQPGPDPYNSSGSFDRTKSWARVGKR